LTGARTFALLFGISKDARPSVGRGAEAVDVLGERSGLEVGVGGAPETQVDEGAHRAPVEVGVIARARGTHGRHETPPGGRQRLTANVGDVVGVPQRRAQPERAVVPHGEPLIDATPEDEIGLGGSL
jgi:hypothetical protein